MRIDSPIMTNAILTGSFSGSFKGIIEESTIITGALPAGVVSGSSQVDITATTGYTTFSSSIASDIAGLDGEYATDAQLSAVSSSAAADIASNLSSINSIGSFTASLDSDLTTLSLPANTTISSFGASLVDDADATAAKTTLGLENVTNESKATMFSSPTFTGTVSGVTATHVGLGNVTNESKATMFTNAALTGTPTAPTAITSTDTTQIATTAFVQSRLSEIIDTAPAALDTLNELAAAIGDDPNISASLATTISTKLAKSANLSDLADAAAARTNLGVDAAGTVNYVHPTHPGDDLSIDTGALTGAVVISDLDINVTTDTLGHVTDANATVATRTLTLANLGYTGATDANNYAITQDNTSNVHFEGLMVGQTTGATANTIRCVGDVVAYYSSDAQFKDNVVQLEGALDKVKQIRGVEFDWNDKQDVHTGHDIGVIAQEVEAVYPDLVHHREHNDSKAVDYVKLTAVLIEAVKELAAKVEELEKK